MEAKERTAESASAKVEAKTQEGGKVTVTYESLFDLLIREKTKDELQQLDKNFFSDLTSYLKDKIAIIEALSAANPGEAEKAKKQLQNIHRIVKDLYERREKKIMSMALARSRAAADVIDTSALLEEEKALFSSLTEQLDYYRQSLLNNLISAQPLRKEELRQTEPVNEMQQQMRQQTTSAEAKDTDAKNTKLVRFLHAVPRFVGKELEVYGPFEQEDIANLPAEIAGVLIHKGRAEELLSSKQQ